jgi:hypothetical protein
MADDVIRYSIDESDLVIVVEYKNGMFQVRQMEVHSFDDYDWLIERIKNEGFELTKDRLYHSLLVNGKQIMVGFEREKQYRGDAYLAYMYVQPIRHRNEIDTIGMTPLKHEVE